MKDYESHSYDYRLTWTPFSPIAITNRIYNEIRDRDWFSARLVFVA